jgi:hypothetical protein
MKKLLLSIGLGLSWVIPAHSATLSLVPTTTTIDGSVGSTVEVAVVISDLGFYLPDSLSTYDITLNFNSSILAADSITFGDPDPFTGNQLDLGAGSFNDGLISTGSVNLIELSFAPAFVLDTQQVGSFTLATIQFSTTGYGSTAIDFGTVVLGDSLGDPLSASLVNTVLVSVPVPAAVWLFGSALGLLGWVRRRQPNRPAS